MRRVSTATALLLVVLLVRSSTATAESSSFRAGRALLAAWSPSRSTTVVFVYSGAAGRKSAERAAMGLSHASKKIVPTIVEFESTAMLLSLVVEQKAGAIFVDPSAARSLSAVLQVVRAKKLVTLTSSLSLVERGIAIGVFSDEGRLRLAINERAARLSKVSIRPAALRVARIIRRSDRR